jgi:Na+/H+-dicarboxylate symporter
MKRIPLHWQIFIGLGLGLIWGILANNLGLIQFTKDFIKPFGTIFLSFLKLIAVPLVLVSLIKGISSMSDMAKLSRIGTKAIGLYLLSTVIAISVGLAAVNFFQPGKAFPEEKQQELKEQYSGETEKRAKDAQKVEEEGPLQFLVNIVPQNIFSAMSDNANMLQVIFFAILFGVALVILPHEKAKPVIDLFYSLNDIVLTIVDMIMKFAPIGVFALLSGVVVDFAGELMDLAAGLGSYTLVVVAGLASMVLIVYPIAIIIFTPKSYTGFLKAISPAQLVAFSTSSSAATLPVTMDRAEKGLGVSKEVSSFVLPLGATINMDGTSLYQAVAAVFIAQAFGLDLTFVEQLSIVLTATLASIGAAAVPGAGMVMLVIVLNQLGINPAGIALIVAMDRPLDMLRTTVNITGDSAISTIIAKTEGQLQSVT